MFDSIKKKIIIPTALFFVLIMSLLTATLIWQGQKAQHAMLDSKATSTVNFIEKISATYIVNYDLTALESFITELSKDPDVAFAEFYDQQKKLLTKATRPKNLDESLLVYDRSLKDNSGITLGYLTVGYKQDVIKQTLSDNLTASMVVWAFGLFFCVVGLTITVVTVTRPISELDRVISAVAKGRLDQRIDISSHDELGAIAKSVNTMVENLRDLIGQIWHAANAISDSTTKFDQTASQISQSSQNQNKAAVETAKFVEEITHSIDQVAMNAKEAVEISHEANRICEEGQRIVRDAATEMTKIAGSVSDSARMVTSLGQRSTEISSIIEVIKTVADQTNLLALNAAIEAARAGEQGRGFAVVADEVRSLAQRTTGATSEITRTIDAIQSDTQNVVTAMENGNSRVDHGVSLTNSGAEALDRIISSVEKSLLSINEIATATVQQSGATHEIVDHVDNITKLSEKNYKEVNQLLSATEQLQELAASLQSHVSRFTL